MTGLLGLAQLYVAQLMLRRAVSDADTPMIAFATLYPLLGTYLAWVGYATWFRLSPRVVRHVCGAVAFCGLAIAVMALPQDKTPLPPWLAWLFLACLIAALWAYRAASRRIGRQIFGDAPAPAGDA